MKHLTRDPKKNPGAREEGQSTPSLTESTKCYVHQKFSFVMSFEDAIVLCRTAMQDNFFGTLTGRFHGHPAVQSQANARGWEPSFASSGSFEARPIHRPSRTWTAKEEKHCSKGCMDIVSLLREKYSLKGYIYRSYRFFFYKKHQSYCRLTLLDRHTNMATDLRCSAHLSTTPSAGFSCPCPIEMLMNFPVHVRRLGDIISFTRVLKCQRTDHNSSLAYIRANKM